MKDNTDNNLYMKLENDLVLDYDVIRSGTTPSKFEYVYTLACRTDPMNPKRWSAIPEIYCSAFMRDSEALKMYIDSLKEQRRYFLAANPKFYALLSTYKKEIDDFNALMNKLKSDAAKLK